MQLINRFRFTFFRFNGEGEGVHGSNKKADAPVHPFPLTTAATSVSTEGSPNALRFCGIIPKFDKKTLTMRHRARMCRECHDPDRPEREGREPAAVVYPANGR